MSNRAFLLFRSEVESSKPDGKKTRTIEIPLIDDFTLDITTNFQKASDLLGGGFADTIQRLMQIQTAMSSQTPTMKFLFDLLVWDNTEPFKFNLEAIFYTKYDPVADVLEPVIDLLSMCMLSVKGNNFYVPGVSLRTLKKFWKVPTDSKTSSGGSSERLKPITTSLEDTLGKSVEESYADGFSKVALLWIPGVILLEKAIITSVKPTFSKEITENEVPLWAKVDIEVTSVMPANTGDLIKDYKMYRAKTTDKSIGVDVATTMKADVKRTKAGQVQRFYFKNFGGY